MPPEPKKLIAALRNHSPKECYELSLKAANEIEWLTQREQRLVGLLEEAYVVLTPWDDKNQRNPGFTELLTEIEAALGKTKE